MAEITTEKKKEKENFRSTNQQEIYDIAESIKTEQNLGL